MVFSPAAYRQFSRLPKQAQRRIAAKIDFFLAGGNPPDFSRPMIDRRFGQFRFRIGVYRVIFDTRNHTIIVRAVGHRRDIYR